MTALIACSSGSNCWLGVLQLKSQQEAIEGLVDTVVQGYHSGFNKAIHNYSQILHLFSVSKDQVRSLPLATASLQDISFGG